MRKVYEMEACNMNVTQLSHIETSGRVWRYREQITVAHLTQHLAQLSPRDALQYQLLKLFINQVQFLDNLSKR